MCVLRMSTYFGLRAATAGLKLRIYRSYAVWTHFLCRVLMRRSGCSMVHPRHMVVLCFVFCVKAESMGNLKNDRIIKGVIIEEISTGEQ